jgi:hypothetical protein
LNAQVVVDENVRFLPDALMDRYNISFSAFPEHGAGSVCEPVGCFSGVLFSYDGHSVQRLEEDLLWPSAWYFAQYGAVLNSSTPFDTQPEPFEVGSGDFYLGIRIPNITEPFGYGWVHFGPVNGVLAMLENVMAYGVDGLGVGTKQIVPEPRTWVVSMATIGIACSA